MHTLACPHTHTQMHTDTQSHMHMDAHTCTHSYREMHRDIFLDLSSEVKGRGLQLWHQERKQVGTGWMGQMQGWGNHAQCFSVGQKSKVDHRMVLLGGS